MKMNKNMLAVGTALLMILPMLLMAFPKTNAKANISAYLPVSIDHNFRGVWYKFETPNITLLFPAKGTKPMFIWWYTEDNSTVYVIKFKGLIEYLIFDIDKPYYRSRFCADNVTINATLWKNHIEPKLRLRWGYMALKYREARNRFLGWLFGLHSPFLPFSACKWNLTGPEWIKEGNTSYLAFSFILSEIPERPRLQFARGNIEIRCRFYNTTTTEVPDPDNYPNYNYTVAAGQLKFDLIVRNWEWNIDKLRPFLELLEKEYDVEVPDVKTGLALWVNMASITIQDLTYAENEVKNQAENQVEAESQMQGTMIGDKYYPVDKNEIGQDEKPIEATLRLRERFRKRIRLHFAHRQRDVPVGFLEFVPWARLLNETGETVKIVNVTASYIAAGHHLRLFICYPYFGDYTLEHDPTIGLASAPSLPTLLTPEVIGIMLLTTVIVTIAILAYKKRKETINIISP